MPITPLRSPSYQFLSNCLNIKTVSPFLRGISLDEKKNNLDYYINAYTITREKEYEVQTYII